MIINNNLLDKLAYLCRLELASYERHTMLHDLNEMVGLIEQLDTVQVEDGVVLDPIFMLKEGHLRLDNAWNTLTQEQALELAPSSDANYFQVPSVKDPSYL